MIRRLMSGWELPFFHHTVQNSNYGQQIGIEIDPKIKFIAIIGAFDTDSIEIGIAGAIQFRFILAAYLLFNVNLWKEPVLGTRKK